MATNCQNIGNVMPKNCQESSAVTAVIKSSTMTHEEQQQSTSKLSKKVTPTSHEDANIPFADDDEGLITMVGTTVSPTQPLVADDVFENVFDASMADLEHADAMDGYESDSESANEDNDAKANAICQAHTSNGSDDLTYSSGLGCSVLSTFPRSSSFEYRSSSDSEEEQPEEIFSAINLSPKFFPTDSRNADIFLSRPYLLPFTERRRLSQCKEEDEEDGTGEKSPQPHGPNATSPPKFEKQTVATPPPPPPPPQNPASAEKFKELERLRHQFMHKIDIINTSNIEEISQTLTPDGKTTKPPPPPPPPIPPTILPKSLINLLQSTKTSSPTPAPTKLAELDCKQPPLTVEESPPVPAPQVKPVIQAAPFCKTPTTSRRRSPSPEKTIIKGKFTVTKAYEPPVALQKLRPNVDKLKQLDASANAYTISFPSSFGGYSSVQGLFSQRYGSHKLPTAVPHLDKQFFDSSLVEIRESTQNINQMNINPEVATPPSDERSRSATVSRHQSMKCDTSSGHVGVMGPLDEVWIKRSTATPPKRPVSLGDDSSVPTTAAPSEDEQDGRLPGSRPSSAPAEPNAKAARKASKKMEKEARRQEKELRSREKEARKMERETARRLEREAAKLEKLNRNTEKISRSTERMAPRSGSLERRRSGEDSPVLNQSTVHGIASPNRRPTIFDVFRPRAKSDAKRQKDKILLDPLAQVPVRGPDRDTSSSTSSTHSGTSGGIMNTMKVAMQHTGLIGGHHNRPAVTVTAAESTPSAKTKYKDGSAHPHQGSDAQYYHTVTAVRRSDATRSPMTKVMDLFRHRSNSAVSEADKRKARAAAHQLQLAVQSEYLSKNLFCFCFHVLSLDNSKYQKIIIIILDYYIMFI